MGDRKCAFDGCNALEFRTSGYCLRHEGGLSYEKTRYFETPEKTRPEPATITEIWWIPLLQWSFPLFFFALSFTGLIEYYSADIADFLLVLIFSACFLLVLCSPILLPIYAGYLVRIRQQRIENGEWNLFSPMFHLLSLISPMLVLLVFLMLASALGGA